MSKVKRIDGFDCTSGCYNYCNDPQHDHIFCRGTKTYMGIDKLMGVVVYTYRIVKEGNAPDWCPLDRS